MFRLIIGYIKNYIVKQAAAKTFNQIYTNMFASTIYYD